jgi:pyruvate/2-oxoglutarate dehydrogenase complex dihydrolipoamide acyltransferase (E2) component
MAYSPGSDAAMPTTTHLVCAPDDLLAPAVVTEWLALAGSVVSTDAPLVRLAVAGEVQLVLTPMDGVLTECCVAVGEPLAASDLIAMIEAEEPVFGMTLIPEDEAQSNLSLAACRQAPADAGPVVGGQADAMALCASLGIAPDDIPGRGTRQLTRRDVERHVRSELRLLATLRQLLGHGTD